MDDSPLAPPGWHPEGSRGMRWQTWAVIAVLVVVGIAMLGHADEPATDMVTTNDEATASPQPAPTTPATTPGSAAAAVLFITDQKDGDSFVASDGNEYRLGMVNTAEMSEPCGPDAARFTRDFLADGFTVDAYSRDRHGRRVAEVFDRSGRSLNVALARSGLGNDRFLDQFRYENPDLAQRLDAAFASADAPSCRF